MFELGHGSSGECAEAGFEFGPGFFDRVQIRRVGRQVEHGCPAGLDAFTYAVDLVCAEVVHDDHMTGTQLRAQHLVEEGQENVAVCGGLDGHGCEHAGVVHGAKDREDLPVAAGNPVADATAFRSTAVESRHLRRDAAFININQVFGRDRADGLEVDFAPVEVLFGVALNGME